MARPISSTRLALLAGSCLALTVGGCSDESSEPIGQGGVSSTTTSSGGPGGAGGVGGAGGSGGSVEPMGPLVVHADNPRYFAMEQDPAGPAVYLTGSHTWASLQERGVAGQTPDFDYDGFLDFLQAHNHNFFRLWAWEHTKWMQFTADPVRYEPHPWARTGPGHAIDGLPKFDLHTWDESYFQRLRERVREAQSRRIYVAVMLFQGFSVSQKSTGVGEPIDSSVGNQWEGHPFHRDNNINGIDGDPNADDRGQEVHTLALSEITELQEAYVTQVIDTVNEFDNVLWEISNESHGSSTPWQYHFISFIRSQQQQTSQQHPIGMTFQFDRGDGGNNQNLFDSAAQWISPAGNAYFTGPPAATGDKVIILDTDHVQPGTVRDKLWAWRQFARGNNPILMDGYLDFRVGAPAEPEPEWEDARDSMGDTLTLANQLDLAAMEPADALSSTGYCLASPGVSYLVLQPEAGQSFTVDLESGTYQLQWFDVTASTIAETGTLTAAGGDESFTPPVDEPAVLILR